jgi:histidine triad (HIT) family protein
MSADCIFCKIVSRAIPSPLVYEDSEVVAFQDINPQAAQHLLIIPRQHFADVGAAAAAGEGALLGKLLTVATQLASERGLVQGGYRLVCNTGKDGGQTVRHLHFHLLGGRPLGWPPG